MKHAKILSTVFGISSIVLSVAMCALVAYEYVYIDWSGRHFLTSAPPYVAFFLAIPFIIPIVACLILHFYFKKKSQ